MKYVSTDIYSNLIYNKIFFSLELSYFGIYLMQTDTYYQILQQ
jgi:hypothetical protein